MSGKPTLAIVIPCWNASKFLAKLLDSILLQTYTDWVLYAVDDQSTDNTLDILERYQKDDSRIKLIVRSRLPKGAQTCRNIGFEQAMESKYVIFMDSDDLIAPYCFEQRVAYMEKHKDLDYAVFKAKSFSETPADKPRFILGFDDSADELKSILMLTIPYSVWNNIYRVEELKKHSIKWDENIMSWQDSDFIIQCLCKKLRHSFASNAKLDYYWRIAGNEGSITSKIFTSAHFKSHIYFINKLHCQLGDIENTNEFHYRLLVLAEMFKQDKYTYRKFLKLPLFEKKRLMKLKLSLYERFPNNSKIRRILFPALVSTYLRYNENHMNSLHSELFKLQ